MSTRQRSARTRIRRLAVGRSISITGGAAAYTALNFTVWDRTHSPSMQALSLLLTFGVAGLLGSFAGALGDRFDRDRKSTRLNSSHVKISYAVFCLKKKKKISTVPT